MKIHPRPLARLATALALFAAVAASPPAAAQALSLIHI